MIEEYKIAETATEQQNRYPVIIASSPRILNYCSQPSISALSVESYSLYLPGGPPLPIPPMKLRALNRSQF